jgi:hypothetical protein
MEDYTRLLNKKIPCPDCKTPLGAKPQGLLLPARKDATVSVPVLELRKGLAGEKK